MKRKALFLDRDGVINVDYGYVNKVDDFVFVDGIFELTQHATEKGYVIIVVTNQAGIGRGFYSIDDFNFLTDWMCEKFYSNGVKLSKVYFSPYHPTYGLGEYKREDESRKPNPGMILQAAEEFNLDLLESILVGDKLTDIQAGISAGVGMNILFANRNETMENMRQSYYFVPSLLDIKAMI